MGRYINCANSQLFPIFFVDLPQVSIEPWLGVECFFATCYRAFVFVWSAVDGLNVHQQVVTNAETTPTFFTLETEKKKKSE